jgi:GGDEF domain-containing protein
MAEKIDWSLMLMQPTGQSCEDPLEQLLRQTLREEDHWYHREKNGFAILLRNTSAEGSVYLANRIQKQLKESLPECYYSVGITPLQEEWSPEEVIARGEKTLSQSRKREGGVIILFDAHRSRYRIFAPSREDQPREKEGVPQ